MRVPGKIAYANMQHIERKLVNAATQTLYNVILRITDSVLLNPVWHFRSKATRVADIKMSDVASQAKEQSTSQDVVASDLEPSNASCSAKYTIPLTSEAEASVKPLS